MLRFTEDAKSHAPALPRPTILQLAIWYLYKPGLGRSLYFRRRQSFLLRAGKFPALLYQDRHAFGHGVDAEHRGDHQNLHDLIAADAVAQHIGDMDTRAGVVQMRSRRIDGDINKFGHLKRQAAGAPE